ncbi:MAG: hypothetical protein D6728_11670 [Cyanobacteria bacterium J055]|nr:MAG: hypothetical protein D6728_11670 [Cyanobacteria bacterium J055]
MEIEYHKAETPSTRSLIDSNLNKIGEIEGVLGKTEGWRLEFSIDLATSPLKSKKSVMLSCSETLSANFSI